MVVIIEIMKSDIIFQCILGYSWIYHLVSSNIAGKSPVNGDLELGKSSNKMED